MKKILLTSGDSYTDKNWFSEIHPDIDTGWPKWPELLAKKLDMECVNLGKSGAGNEYIYTSLLDYITDEKTVIENIGLVIPAWSQCQRKDYQQGQSGRWTNFRKDPHGDAYSWVNRSLKYYLSFQIMCERYNLNYLQMQMIDFYSGVLNGLSYGHGDIFKNPTLVDKKIKYTQGNKERDLKRILNCILNYDKKINEKKFLGWPIAKEFNGFIMCGKSSSPIFSKNEGERLKFQVSYLDDHPNKIGQEKIAEFIYDRLG